MNRYEIDHSLTRLGGKMKRSWFSQLFISLSIGLLAIGSADAATLVPITACTGCHGTDPQTNKSPTESSTRNSPTGAFIGSHTYHVNTQALLCSDCHVVPTAMDHRNGKIQMASPMKNGVVYNKTVAGVVTQTNKLDTSAMGTCSGGTTPCHSTASPIWGTASNCQTCHGYPPVTTAADVDNKHVSGATPVNHIGTGATVNTKATFNAAHGGCQICHGTQGATNSPTDTTHNPIATYNVATDHATGNVNMNGPTTAPSTTSTQYDSVTHGCNAACHANDATHRMTTSGKTYTYGAYGGGGDCVTCHSVAQGSRDAVVGEFGLAWGHKKSGRGAVKPADCIVCHLEGNYASQSPSAYHRDGKIDLRDPDGAGETPITNISGGAFTFTRYSSSYAAGTRTNTGHTSNTDIANVITQKFCLKCHDSNGATNPTARSNNGGTGTQYMPFGGINLGANYTIANDAAAVGGLIDVASQFVSTNSSYHPLTAPLNRDFPAATRLAAPYNNNGGRAGTSGTKTLSVVLNCFDCHNTPAPLTTRTIIAHGNAASLRGTIYASGAASTLCTTCHTGYTVSGTHSTGSAWSATGSSHNVSRDCQACHGSQTTSTRSARPLGAQDYHGNNALVGGGLWTGVTPNSRPYAFIRGWTGGAYHRPLRSSEFTTGSATCGAGTCPIGGQVGDGSTRTYTAGGSY